MPLAAARPLRWLYAAAAFLVGAALVEALVLSPPERAMGELVRILYVHAGAAWTAYLAYVVTAVGAVMHLRSRRPLWDRVSVASAEWGVVLTTIALLTGSLWGRAAQGWWWTWDPRQTLTLMLWLLYAGYLILRQYTSGERRATLSAVLALAGLPTMLLNHFAVTLFRADHPPQIVVRGGGPFVDPEIFWPLALSLLAYTALYLALLAARVDLEALRARATLLRREA